VAEAATAAVDSEGGAHRVGSRAEALGAPGERAEAEGAEAERAERAAPACKRDRCRCTR
jgi:hypothetical protein